MSLGNTDGINSIFASISTGFRPAHLHSALLSGGSYLTTTDAPMMGGWRVSQSPRLVALRMASASRPFERGCWPHTMTAISSFPIRVFSATSFRVHRAYVVWAIGSTTSSRCRPTATSSTKLSGRASERMRVRGGLSRLQTLSFSGYQNDAT